MSKSGAQHGRSPRYRFGDQKHPQVSTQDIKNPLTQMINSRSMKFVLLPRSMKKEQWQVVEHH